MLSLSMARACFPRRNASKLSRQGALRKHASRSCSSSGSHSNTTMLASDEPSRLLSPWQGQAGRAGRGATTWSYPRTNGRCHHGCGHSELARIRRGLTGHTRARTATHATPLCDMMDSPSGRTCDSAPPMQIVDGLRAAPPDHFEPIVSHAPPKRCSACQAGGTQLESETVDCRRGWIASSGAIASTFVMIGDGAKRCRGSKDGRTVP